ncbi:MAG TPA: peptide ABC transporter substrate-binding protein [Rhabdochlamydiaceae bacterium]|nr:peptide ABC transporter substrate-binding protein [Rhabdochlamydiaceae bacterium]
MSKLIKESWRIHTKKKAIARLIILSALILSCCQKSPTLVKQKQILRTALSYDVNSMDPRLGANMTSQSVIRSTFTGLVYLDKDLVPQLDLASSYRVSSDFKTYIFFLRECCWSDGSAITAKDFEESWKSVLTPAFASLNTNLFYFIKNGKKAFEGVVSIDQVGVHAIDEKTLVVELEEPNPSFLNVLTSSIFFPVHESMRYEKGFHEKIVSSGPFRLKKHLLQDQIVLEKNPFYWQAEKTHLDEIQFFIIKDAATAMLLFEKKELDWLGEPTARLSLDSIPTIKAQGKLNWVDGAGLNWLFINTKKPPYSNVNIRKALAYSIDRSKIMKDILHIDNVCPPLGLIPKILKNEKWHPWFQDNDRKKAQECFAQGLQELGITLREFPPIVISYVHDASYSKIVQAVQQMWQETLGVTVKSECSDGPVFARKLFDLDYDIARSGWVLQYNDPGNLLDIFKYKKLQPNFSGWENPHYIEESNAAYSACGEDKWAHWEAAEKIFFDEMPSIPLIDVSLGHIRQDYVKNVYVNSLHQISFRDAYIEK